MCLQTYHFHPFRNTFSKYSPRSLWILLASILVLPLYSTFINFSLSSHWMRACQTLKKKSTFSVLVCCGCYDQISYMKQFNGGRTCFDSPFERTCTITAGRVGGGEESLMAKQLGLWCNEHGVACSHPG